MACSSSSATPVAVDSPFSNHTASYDVFMSFRGKDTRHSFTDHLFKALVRAGLRPFRDNDEIDRGRELKPDIERGIIKSRASIIVLSENYANSRWCLNELCLILERRRNLNHFVLPIFYHVSPSDVRNQRRRFCTEGSQWKDDNANIWKAALTEVANLNGMVVSGSETEFIAKVVDTIDSKLDMKRVSTPAHLTGMESRAEAINFWLKDEQSSANVIVICGMGGSGKTTLAQYIYNANKKKFDGSSFIAEIGNQYKQPFGLLGLQKQLLEDVVGGKSVTISNVSEGTNKIEEALQTKRVLIVLDDIDDQDEIGTLLGTKAFHTQSKILITTRLRDIDAWFGSISLKCWVYKHELLNHDESLELLSWHAFGSKIPVKSFMKLAVKLVHYCGGNPLALKVLGSSLFVSPEDPVKCNSMIEIWKSRMNSLNSLKGDLHCKIQGVLQKSFDALPLSCDKELFLHIACFFVGEYKYKVITILEDDWYAKSGLMTLINRCLLTISPHGKLVIHQLLQVMGRKIVSEESKDPAKRSRVWRDDESYRLLKKGDGSDTIEGLALDMRKVEKGTRSEASTLNTCSLAKLDKLKLLQLKNVELCGSYEKFPDLRWFCWQWCYLKTIPSGLLMSSLVAIDMSHGCLEKFEPPKVLNSLKILNLKGCYKLVSIGKIHRLPNLETLILWDCSSLTDICKTIGDLEGLTVLNLTGCKKLWKDSSDKTYVKSERLEKPLYFLPNSLKSLILNHCELKYNNDVFAVVHPQSLFHLSLSGNLFEFLPRNINLKMLRILNLTCCPNLKSILCLPSTLEVLYIHWCTSLETITFQSAPFRLQKFKYECCFKLLEIQGLFKLVPITKIDESDLGHMKWIKAYEYNKVELVGDVITQGRIWRIQMLYEYGIRSTFLPGINYQSRTTSQYSSSSRFLSFQVPLCPEKGKFQGLNVVTVYTGASGEDIDRWFLLAKISNTTKGLTWIYNPVVYCKPKGDEGVLWLSYWPIGNILEAGDVVNVDIILGKGLVVSECGASLVYMDDDGDEVEQKGNQKNNAKCEEVIGGDLSEFEVTTGGYYLCRRDYFESNTSYMLKMLFNDTVHYPESQGWRKSRQLFDMVHEDLKTFKDSHRKRKFLSKLRRLAANSKRL